MCVSESAPGGDDSDSEVVFSDLDVNAWIRAVDPGLLGLSERDEDEG